MSRSMGKKNNTGGRSKCDQNVLISDHPFILLLVGCMESVSSETQQGLLWLLKEKKKEN